MAVTTSQITITTMEGWYSGNTTPSNPLIGDLWLDTTSNEIKKWDGTNWVKQADAQGPQGPKGDSIKSREAYWIKSSTKPDKPDSSSISNWTLGSEPPENALSGISASDKFWRAYKDTYSNEKSEYSDVELIGSYEVLNGLVQFRNGVSTTENIGGRDVTVIDGGKILTGSIKADKMSIKDLSALKAKIGGFNIGKNSIYSGTKSSINNTEKGIYFDSNGHSYFGDDKNFIRFYQSAEDGKYKLQVSADSLTFGSGVSVEKAFEDIKGDVQNAQDSADNVKDQIVSMGEQLIINGNGLMGDNTNFSALIFDASKANGSPGSFTREGTSYTKPVSDTYIPINPNLRYSFEIDAISKNGLIRMYSFLNFYDVDKKPIDSDRHMYIENTLTYLTQDLKNGDTVVHFNDLSGWNDTFTQHYRRGFIFWNYTNSFGYTYPELTYSRNIWRNLYENSNVDKTNNTITLNAPWSHGTFEAGTKLSQCNSGATYKYQGMSYTKVPTEWTHYSGFYDGTDYSGKNVQTKFPPGTAYAKVGFMWNCDELDDQCWVTNISLKTDYDNAIKNAQTAADNAQGTADAANVKIDNLEIGGRNLLKQYIWAGGRCVKIDNLTVKVGTEVADTYFYLRSHCALTAGETYTISCEASNVPDGCNWSFGVRTQSSAWQLHINKNGKIFATGVLDADVDADTDFILDDMNGRPSTAPNIILTNFKLEKGSKATDWTPAPEDVDAGITDAQTAADEALKGTKENAAQMAQMVTNLNGDIKNLQDQIDGNITTWFYDNDPAMNLPPVTDWDTDKKKEAHLGDIYYNTVKGYAWRFMKSGSTYSWERITDTDVTKALSDAAKAQDTANSKRRVFYNTPTVPYDAGDLWVQGSGGDILRCAQAKTSTGSYDRNDWILASKYTDDSALTTWIKGDFATTIQGLEEGLVDAKIETYYQTTDPSTGWSSTQKSEHKGDLWYNSTTSVQKYYRWSGTAWQELTATPPQAVFDDIDNKATIYTGTTPPSSPSPGDLWFKGENEPILTYVNNSWVEYNKYTDDSTLNTWLKNTYTVDKINLEKQIDGKAETWYQNTDPSSKWSADEKSNHEGDLWYNTSNNTTWYYTGSDWLQQNIPTSVFNNINGKANIFVGSTTPDNPKTGDLWMKSTNSDILTYVNGSWAKYNKYTDDTRAEEAAKTADNYISADSTSIMISENKGATKETPSNATKSNVLITDQDVQIRNGQKTVASYGKSAIIGENKRNNIQIKDTGFSINHDGNEMFAVKQEDEENNYINEIMKATYEASTDTYSLESSYKTYYPNKLPILYVIYRSKPYGIVSRKETIQYGDTKLPCTVSITEEGKYLVQFKKTDWDKSWRDMDPEIEMDYYAAGGGAMVTIGTRIDHGLANDGSWSLTVGSANTAGSRSIAVGENNVARDNSVAIGSMCYARNDAIAVGSHAIATSYRSAAIGDHVSTDHMNQLVVGQYNRQTPYSTQFVVGCGGDSETANTAAITASGDIRLKGTVYIGCEKDSTGGKSIIDLIYPVGSIYMSVNSTDPSTLFGGSWERIQDRFLLASGSTYGAGTTGGSADSVVVSHTHAQTAHSHGFGGGDKVWTTASGSTEPGNQISGSGKYYAATEKKDYKWRTRTDGATANIQSTGVDGTGKNMPPYLAVYVWKRVS